MKRFVSILKNYKWSIVWLFFILCLITYLVGAFYFKDRTWHGDLIQVGGLMITLLTTILIMLMNNEKIDRSTILQLKQMRAANDRQIREIQETTEKHIGALEKNTALEMGHLTTLNKEQKDNFIEQTKEITSRLEEVAKNMLMLADLTAEMVDTEKELKKIEETKLIQRQAELRRQETETKTAIERIKPSIYYIISEEMEFFITYKTIGIYNGGGDASALRINIEFKDSGDGKVKKYDFSYSNLRRSQTIYFRLNRSKSLLGYNIISVNLFVWDINQREYRHTSIQNRSETDWIKLETREAN